MTVVATDVPFVVTMAYPNAALIALLTVVAVAVAATYSWRVHSDDSTADKPITAFVTTATTIIAGARMRRPADGGVGG